MYSKVIVLLSVLAICVKFVSTAANRPIVTTPSGKVEGSTLTSRLGKTIYSFRGIRYAKAPIGELRFKPPVPIDTWRGVYDATEDGSPCFQPTDSGPNSEDCLILNVYSTKLPCGIDNPKRPVVIYIHTGGFYASGSKSTWVGPQYFMDQDIVLVTFNYRLGPLGFLSTGDKYAPGNNGMRDQVEALKWVKKNIASFGGDPGSVTLLGYSAGGWSVILHLLSPMSQGLFNKAISMSGSPVGIYSLPTNQLEVAKKQARLVGCPDDTSEKIVKCLRTVPAEKFRDVLPQYAEFGYDPVLIWTPVVEGDFGAPRFLTENPTRQFLQGRFQKVPMIIGNNKDELGFAALFVVNNETLRDEMNRDFERVLPIIMVYERNTERSKNISRTLRSYYLHDKPVDESQFYNLAQLYVDGLGFEVDRAAKLLAEYSTAPVYRYRFNFQGTYSNFYLPDTNNTVPWGTVHQDELIYLFYNQVEFPKFSKDSPKPDVYMVDKLTTLYANFAKTGKPIPHPCGKLDNTEWVPYTLAGQKYMAIGDKLVMKERLKEVSYAVWDKLFPVSEFQ